jgi:multiple sugar transport system substrate-binding protein
MSNHRIPRVIGILLVLGLISTLLGACAPGERQEVNFVFMRTSDNTEPYWQGVIRDFEAENPNIKVNLFIFEWTDGQRRIREMIDQGNPPTLARVATRWVPEYMAAGLLEPVDDHITTEFRAQFNQVLINDGAQYEGLTFGLPMTVTTRALFYNKTLFARAGIASPPQTWDELREAAQAIDALGADTYGFGIQGKGVDTSTYFYYFLLGNGGNILTADGTRPAFDGPEGLEAINFMHDLIADGLTQPNPTESDRPDLHNLFMDGKLGMVISLPTLVKVLAEQTPDLDYGLSNIPHQTTPFTFAAQDTLILFKQADNKDAAWKFIEFLYQDEYRLKYALTESILPEKISVAENPQFKENRSLAFFMERLPDGRFEPLNVRSASIADTIGFYLQAAYRGEMTPQEALAEAAVQVQLILFYSATTW